MASLPQETPQEDIRNAMAIIANLHTIAPAMAGGIAYELPVADRLAIMARLASAVRKLEGHVTMTMHGLNQDCPDVVAGRATRCPGHRQ